MLLNGAYMMCGVKLTSVAGETLTNKIESAMGAGLEKFVQDSQEADVGFFAVHDEIGSIITVPAGYLVFLLGNHDADGTGAYGIRWGALQRDKSVAQQAASIVSDVLIAYPTLENEYTAWKACLETYVVPSFG